MKKYLIIALALTTMLLSGCGFHLRGQYQFSESMQPLFIDSENEEFKYELYDILQFGGMEITEDINQANGVLQFLREDFRKSTVSLDDRGQATRYQLRYIVEYRVVNIDGELLLEETTNSTSRTLDYNAAQQLQADEEEEELSEEMFSDLANTVARRMAKVTGQIVSDQERRF